MWRFFVVLSLFIVGVKANAGEVNPYDFLSKIVVEVKEKCAEETGMDYLNCWADHSPEKCKGLVYESNKAAWSRCVYSCANASFYSKNFGDCSD